MLLTYGKQYTRDDQISGLHMIILRTTGAADMYCVTISNYEIYLEAIFNFTYVNIVILYRSNNTKFKQNLSCIHSINLSLIKKLVTNENIIFI
jgi:hypothetical protein